MPTINKKALIIVAKREMEEKIASLKSQIRRRMGDFRNAPDARQTWSDTSRSQIERLISALSRQLSEDQETLRIFETLKERSTPVVEPGSLVRVTENEEEFFFLLVPRGGSKIELAEPRITIELVSIDSPIGQGLSGHEAGNVVEVKVPAGIYKFNIKEVW